MNALITYYSYSGNTRRIAELIQKHVHGDIFEIEPVKPYPTSYNTVVEQAKKEIQAGFQPEIKGLPKDLASYDTVFIGSPIWWYTMAPPVATFLASSGWRGKTVIPFCTHGGGGAGRMEKEMAALCKDAQCKPALVLSGDGGASAGQQVKKWLQTLGLASAVD